MNTADTFVQPIVLLVDKTDPAAHVDAIRVVAAASVAAYSRDLATGADLAPWNLWLDGPFTKSVRRADAKTFAKLADAYSGLAHPAAVGKARALAFRPAAYENLPKALSRLQVSGTELPERGSDAVSIATQWNIPVLILNGGLGMSTGKAGAQAAHALFAWFLTLDSALRHAWEATGRNFHLHIAGSEEFTERSAGVSDELLIEDAGRTEIETGTATAFVAA
jgi:peptidyl-tRNA hydrolase